MTMGPSALAPRADTTVNPTPLTAVSVNVTGGNVVLTSATGDYEIDTTNGVIHANVFPPTVVSNGGPNQTGTYVLRGIAPGGPVTLVGLAFIGVTSTGIYKFSYDMPRIAQRKPTPETATPITNLRIAHQRPNKFVATAPTGTYLHATGFASQLIADDAVVQPGEQLKIGDFYTIAAQGMPTTMNLQLDHITPVYPSGTLSVFYEVLVDEKA